MCLGKAECLQSVFIIQQDWVNGAIQVGVLAANGTVSHDPLMPTCRYFCLTLCRPNRKPYEPVTSLRDLVLDLKHDLTLARRHSPDTHLWAQRTLLTPPLASSIWWVRTSMATLPFSVLAFSVGDWSVAHPLVGVTFSGAVKVNASLQLEGMMNIDFIYFHCVDYCNPFAVFWGWE